MGAVAKRTLKKSYYDKAITNTYNEDIYNIWNRDSEKENVKNIDKKRKKKQKLLIQSLTVTTLVIIISAIKYFNMETIKNSKFSKNIINEFNENNSFSEIDLEIEQGKFKSPKQIRILNFLKENDGIYIVDLESLTDTTALQITL